jgi:hypothetical protein
MRCHARGAGGSLPLRGLLREPVVMAMSCHRICSGGKRNCGIGTTLDYVQNASRRATRGPNGSKKLLEKRRAYQSESFARGFVNSLALSSSEVAGEQRDMWELMVEAAQNPALHWAVIAVAVLAWILKVLSSGDGALMGDMYHDELDT